MIVAILSGYSALYNRPPFVDCTLKLVESEWPGEAMIRSSFV